VYKRQGRSRRPRLSFPSWASPMTNMRR